MTLAWVVVLVVMLLELTEALGWGLSRFGFETISEAATKDSRIFWAVWAAFGIALLWWPVHIHGNGIKALLPAWLKWFI